MPVRTRFRSAAASDMGRRRTNNEDRYLSDPERGVFAVVDGVGGHAAGEHAAETAVDVLRERLGRQTGTPEERLREAIALANNEIFRLSQARTDWAGMACVLTAAVIEDDVVTVGHVGDSRLYLARPGEIRKVTHDHSPVGEREDRGEISETDAMRHPRRNEIYRDVGSGDRSPDDPAFIEIETFPMPSDGALLLCSDGLSDLVTSAEMLAVLEKSAPDFDAAAQGLIDAANNAGGKDNITVLVVASPGFQPVKPAVLESKPRTWPRITLASIAGLIVGAFAAWQVASLTPDGPRTLQVTGSIATTLGQAASGDTVVIPAGQYTERVQMRAGVTIRASQAGTVTLTSPDDGPAVVASHIAGGTLEGVWIQGSVLIDAASPTLHSVRITGAPTGIEIKGKSAASITGARITNNLGSGIDVGAESHPVITGNLIAGNGRAGIEVRAEGHPILKDNAIVDNAAEPVWIHAKEYPEDDYKDNFFGGLPPQKAIRLLDLPTQPIPSRDRKGAAPQSPANTTRPTSRNFPGVHP